MGTLFLKKENPFFLRFGLQRHDFLRLEHYCNFPPLCVCQVTFSISSFPSVFLNVTGAGDNLNSASFYGHCL